MIVKIILTSIYKLLNIVSRDNFEFLYIIGKGGFGKVWKVQHKQTKISYALKEMSKLKIIDKKSIKSIKSELDLLSGMESPFIVNMHFAFQDKENLYLVMDYLSGGDLRFHISRHKKFSEEQTRFFICCVILSLEYIHSNNIIHRDIKPENLVLEKNGYLRVTDFGIAKKNIPNPNNKIETSGTPGYMSPEVMKSMKHSFCADFFAVGVMGYEFMKGERPYKGKNRKEIKEEIIKRQAKINFEELNENWTKESIDFINKLLIREPENRIGYKNINELKEHPWLKYYPWSLIKDKKLPSPFIPGNKDNFDKKYCEKEDKIGQETNIRYQEIISMNNIDNVFNNFYFNENKDKRRIIKKQLELQNKKSKKNIRLNKKKNHESLIDINEILKEKINSYNKKICELEKLKENKSNNNQVKNVNNIKKKFRKVKHIKSGSMCDNKNGNMIYINFNINNNTNNNIIGSKSDFNDFFISNNNQNINSIINNTNVKTERINFIFQNKFGNEYQTQNETISNNTNINNNLLNLNLNGITLDNNNLPTYSSIKNIIPKISSLKNIINKYNYTLLNKNLSRPNILHHNSKKDINNNKLNLSFKSKNNSSFNKVRHTYSHSYGKKDFDKTNIKKIKKEINKTITVNGDLSFKDKFKKLNKIPSGRISHFIEKSGYNLNHEETQTLQVNSKNKYFKQKIKTTDKFNTSKNNNIEINYSIQEILVGDKNNSKTNKLKYVYSKKSMLERKQNQFNFPLPLSKSNSYQKKVKQDNKIRLSNSKENGSQLINIPQMNKVIKFLKNKGVDIDNKTNNSDRNLIGRNTQNGVTEKIRVNKNFYIN